jgi:GH15 family glucan-1,4-alpha-glucosidase
MTPALDRLVERSIEVISEGQAPSGAYVACPAFPPYRFCWLRDGSFIADAMSRSGHPDSAEAFFDWCSRVILTRRDRPYLAARYTLDGDDDTGEWPRLQHDGYGLWLWALDEHCRRHDRDVGPWAEAAQLTVDYLSRVWDEPCTDWWEERVGIHVATLACLDAGLSRWGADGVVDRSRAEQRIDASTLVLAPLGLGDPLDVVQPIEEYLVSPGGGIHRHLDDTYYGGGEWPLLTAMLGWGYKLMGATGEARAQLEWVAAHATEDGDLPEQSQDHLLVPEQFASWVEKWGPPPCPLLWSHAMLLTLVDAIERFEP